MRGRECDEGTTMTGRADNGAIEHLAILVVYYLRSDDDIPLLELHLDRIERHTRVPYTIFAATNRLSAAARAVVAARVNVVVCDIAPTSMRRSREHGYYLDALLAFALASGASHVCTLDVDSLPITDDWTDNLLRLMPASGLVGVLRRENGDVNLAHPSCILARRELLEEDGVTFAPDPTRDDEYRRFVRATRQAPDTGIALMQLLWRRSEPWGHLLRTNAVDVHPVMGGIYADSVFHLGSTGRSPLFRADIRASWIHRVTKPIENLPIRSTALARVRTRMLRTARAGAERRLIQRNRACFAQLRASLLADSDALFARLRGDADAAATPPALVAADQLTHSPGGGELRRGLS